MTWKGLASVPSMKLFFIQYGTYYRVDCRRNKRFFRLNYFFRNVGKLWHVNTVCHLPAARRRLFGSAGIQSFCLSGSGLLSYFSDFWLQSGSCPFRDGKIPGNLSLEVSNKDFHDTCPDGKITVKLVISVKKILRIFHFFVSPVKDPDL